MMTVMIHDGDENNALIFRQQLSTSFVVPAVEAVVNNALNINVVTIRVNGSDSDSGNDDQ